MDYGEKNINEINRALKMTWFSTKNIARLERNLMDLRYMGIQGDMTIHFWQLIWHGMAK